jgi:hypothetical protein
LRRELALQAVAHDDDAGLLGVAGWASCSTAPCRLGLRRHAEALDVDAFLGTPAASSAASASSFIWKGPQMKAWSMPARAPAGPGTRRACRGPSRRHVERQSVASSLNTWCSTSRVM